MNDLISHICRTLRFPCREDSDGTRIIPGKLGHLYELSLSPLTLGILYLPPTSRKGWKVRREELERLGGETIQNGDLEGSISYQVILDQKGEITSEGKRFIKAAARAIGVKNKRRVNAQQEETLKVRLAKAREVRFGKKSTTQNAA